MSILSELEKVLNNENITEKDIIEEIYVLGDETVIHLPEANKWVIVLKKLDMRQEQRR